MVVNVGGRGYKAKYSTKVIRVPHKLEMLVTDLIGLLNEGMFDEYKDMDIKALMNYFEYVDLDNPMRLDKQESINQAKQILNDKKSARISMQKLLQVICSDDSIKL